MRRATLVSLFVCAGCTSSFSGPDAGVDAGSPPAVDGGYMFDAGRDAGSPPGPDAGPPPVDAGVDAGRTAVACTVESCGPRICGRSACGFPCGECAVGTYCFGNHCADVIPGSPCIDAFGEAVVEGGNSFRVCPSDPTLLQSCLCTGGGASAWIGCAPACERVDLAGDRGARCATDAQCAAPLACHPYLHLCGERCDRGLGVVCPAGTACGYPGDISGVCLPACTACGDDCGASMTCRPGDPGSFVCAPAGYGWATGC